MNKIKASYEILTPISEGGTKELQHIEKIGRVCYKSEDYITEDGESARKFVAMLIRNGHEAMIEHSFLSVKFTVDRGVSHELVRHRIASFAQESTRYCNYAKDKFGAECAFIDLEPGIMLDNKMKKMSATPQIARAVLPNSTKTEITVSANYREWRNFFKLRVPADVHPQMREVTIPLLKELKGMIPVIFDDIEC